MRYKLQKIKSDASFREFFRLFKGKKTSIIVTASKEIVETDYMLDNWRLNNTFSTNGVVNQYWERFVRPGTAQIGNQMHEASGDFTFPRTGLYLVKFHANVYVATGATSEHIYIAATTDNSSYVLMAIAQTQGLTGNASDTSISCETLVNVTDVANVKVRFTIDGFETGSSLHGAPNSNVANGFARTQVFFERKGPVSYTHLTLPTKA